MRRGAPLILLLTLGALAAVSLLKVKFSSDLYQLLPGDLPEVRGLQYLESHFGRGSELIVVLEGEDSESVGQAVRSLATHLEGRQGLFGVVAREQNLEEVLAEGGELFAWQWLNAEPAALRRLVDSMEPAALPQAIDRAFWKMENSLSEEAVILASYDPLGVIPDGLRAQEFESFRSEDGRMAVLFVEGHGADFSDYREAAVWVESVKETVAPWVLEEGGDVKVSYTGTPALMAEIGSAMQRDMTYSVVATLVLISLLFFVMHGEVRVLSWLVCALLLILVFTMQLGSLLLGKLSVMTVGFAAVLLGLAVDYGVILYREGRRGGRSAKSLRRHLGSSIWWAGATTALVFLSLNLGSFPGLGEMGLLVALGVLSGCFIMLYFFGRVVPARGELEERSRRWSLPHGFGLGVGVLVPLGGVVILLLSGLPDWQMNFHPFRLRESPAIAAWQQYDEKVRRSSAVPIVVTAESPQELRERLAEAERQCQSLLTEGALAGVRSFAPMMAHPDFQRENMKRIRRAVNSSERVVGALQEAGFSEQGCVLTKTLLAAWSGYVEAEGEWVDRPSSPWVSWIVQRISRGGEGSFAALLSVTPSDPHSRDWIEQLDGPHLAVASYGALGGVLNTRVKADLRRVGWPMVGIILVMLSLVYRNWRDVVLTLHCLLTSAAILLMASHGGLLEWNSFNVFAVLILLGTGLDYSIHTILALRREGGDLSAVWAGVGKGLLFCGASSVIGFGSLAFASAHGLASLGLVCAVGMAVNTLVAVWFLPHWYLWLHRSTISP